MFGWRRVAAIMTTMCDAFSGRDADYMPTSYYCFVM